MARVERRLLRPRRPAPVRHADGPAALLAAAAARPRPARRGGARDPEARGRPGALRGRHGAGVDRALDGPRGVARGVGPAAARQVRRARRRHRDGLAVEQAAAAPLRAGRGRRPGAARLPARVVGAAVRRAPGLDRGGGRARDDRPPGRPARPRRRRLRGHGGRGRLVPQRARPAGVPRGRQRALRPRRGHGARRRLRAAPRARAGRGGGGGVPRPRARHRVLRRARAPARARPPVLALLLDQRRRPRAALRRADRARELPRPGALRRPPLLLRRQLPPARARAPRARGRRGPRPLRARPAQGQPRLLAGLGEDRVALHRAGRAADRHAGLRPPAPAAAHAGRRARARQHHPGLSRGPRHQLRRAPRWRRRAVASASAA